jgi:tRNA threonylcarbamoyladenosine biosynthesis protein TsaB
MKVLAIDTSTYVMGVAVTDGENVLGDLMTNIKKNHSLRLMPAIDKLMNEVGVKPEQLERIVVAEGPGSYTGVRIGVTTAKSMAWALNIPIVGVSSLEVLAHNGRLFQGLVCPLFDARRGQVYTGLYETDRLQFQMKCHKADRLVMLNEWLVELKQLNVPILFLGNDLSIHRELIIEKLGSNAVMPQGTMQNSRAQELALLGLKKEPHSNVHTFVPKYLQLAEAEAKWLAANLNRVDNDE